MGVGAGNEYFFLSLFAYGSFSSPFMTIGPSGIPMISPVSVAAFREEAGLQVPIGLSLNVPRQPIHFLFVRLRNINGAAICRFLHVFYRRQTVQTLVATMSLSLICGRGPDIHSRGSRTKAELRFALRFVRLKSLPWNLFTEAYIRC